jgi:hypothetical protein
MKISNRDEKIIKQFIYYRKIRQFLRFYLNSYYKEELEKIGVKRFKVDETWWKQWHYLQKAISKLNMKYWKMF